MADFDRVKDAIAFAQERISQASFFSSYETQAERGREVWKREFLGGKHEFIFVSNQGGIFYRGPLIEKLKLRCDPKGDFRIKLKNFCKTLGRLLDEMGHGRKR